MRSLPFILGLKKQKTFTAFILCLVLIGCRQADTHVHYFSLKPCPPDSIQILEQRQMQLSVDYLEEEKCTVYLETVGENTLSGFALALIENASEDIRLNSGTKSRPIHLQGQKMILSMDSLDLDSRPQNFALKIGNGKTLAENCYPLSVKIPSQKSPRKRGQKWISKDQTVVKPLSLVDNKLRCQYRLPLGNQPRGGNNHIVLKRGEMNENFVNTPLEAFTSTIKVRKRANDTLQTVDLPLTEELQHNEIYTVAYLMGNYQDTIPNLNGLVAWTSFVTP